MSAFVDNLFQQLLVQSSGPQHPERKKRKLLNKAGQNTLRHTKQILIILTLHGHPQCFGPQALFTAAITIS